MPDPAAVRALGRNVDDNGTSAARDETTIVVVAAHALVREGLCAILRDTPGLAVIGEAGHIDAAASLAVERSPDVILLDEPPAGSIERDAVARLRRERPQACVLCLSRDSAVAPGDLLFVPASAGVGELCSVLGVALGGRCADCSLKSTCVAPRIAVALSPRERQVAVCVARGMPSKQIAATLGIALRTVNTYRESLARKLGASSAAVITRFVLEAKLDTVGLP